MKRKNGKINKLKKRCQVKYLDCKLALTLRETREGTCEKKRIERIS
jgi:hypothetical protein